MSSQKFSFAGGGSVHVTELEHGMTQQMPEKVDLSFAEEGLPSVTNVTSPLADLPQVAVQDDLLADFDLRRAVAWAEILHPKFEEY